MKKLLMIVLMTACATLPQGQHHPMEEWTIVFTASSLSKTYGDAAPWVIRSFQQNLDEIFQGLPIAFRYASSVPERGNVLEISDAAPGSPVGLLGRAVGLDHGNRKVDRLVAPRAGVFANRIGFVGVMTYGAVPAPSVAGRGLAVVAAHEIGHALGLYHIATARPYIMAPHNPYRQTGWSPVSSAYLSSVLRGGAARLQRR